MHSRPRKNQGHFGSSYFQPKHAYDESHYKDRRAFNVDQCFNYGDMDEYSFEKGTPKNKDEVNKDSLKKKNVSLHKSQKSPGSQNQSVFKNDKYSYAVTSSHHDYDYYNNNSYQSSYHRQTYQHRQSKIQECNDSNYSNHLIKGQKYISERQESCHPKRTYQTSNFHSQQPYIQMDIRPDEIAGYCQLRLILEYDSCQFGSNPKLIEFEMDDLLTLFRNFGDVMEIMVLPEPNGNIAFVRLSSIPEAFYAACTLDGQKFYDGRVQLKIKFLNPNLDMSQAHTIYEENLANDQTFQEIINTIEEQHPEEEKFTELPNCQETFNSSSYEVRFYNFTPCQLSQFPEIESDFEYFLENYDPAKEAFEISKMVNYPLHAVFFLQTDELSWDDHNASYFEAENEGIGCDPSGIFCFTHRLIGFKAQNIFRIKSDIARILEDESGSDVKIKVYGRSYLCNRSHSQDMINKSNDTEYDGPTFVSINCKDQNSLDISINQVKKLIMSTFEFYVANCRQNGVEPQLKRLFLRPFISPDTRQRILAAYKLAMRKVISVIESPNAYHRVIVKKKNGKNVSMDEMDGGFNPMMTYPAFNNQNPTVLYHYNYRHYDNSYLGSSYSQNQHNESSQDYQQYYEDDMYAYY